MSSTSITIVVALVAATLAAATVVFRTGKWVGHLQEHNKIVSKAIMDINKSIKGMKKDIRRLFLGQERIKTDIKKLSQQMVRSGAVAGGSPLRLTEMGERIAETLEADVWAHEMAKEVKNRIKKGELYEIQELCFDWVQFEYEPTDSEQKRINACVYENGIARSHVLDVLAIVLRDELIGTQEASRANTG